MCGRRGRGLLALGHGREVGVGVYDANSTKASRSCQGPAMDSLRLFRQCRRVQHARRITPAMLLCFVVVAALGCRRRATDERAPGSAPPAAAPAVKPAAAVPPPRGKQITLLYSSNLDGDYEQCGCPVHPLGGVARRATIIDRARSEADAALVLDAGDLFLPQRASFRDGKLPDAGEIERRARLLAAAFSRTGTTALLPGERDLVIGLPLLRRLAKETRVPLVAANLYGKDGKR